MDPAIRGEWQSTTERDTPGQGEKGACVKAVDLCASGDEREGWATQQLERGYLAGSGGTQSGGAGRASPLRRWAGGPKRWRLWALPVLSVHLGVGGRQGTPDVPLAWECVVGFVLGPLVKRGYVVGVTTTAVNCDRGL